MYVTFNVKQQNASPIADGQIDFSFAYTAVNGASCLYGTCTYRVSANANGQQLFSIAQSSAIPPVNGVYTIPNQTYANNAKINIPSAGHFDGGNYNTLSNITFTPSATSPTSSGTLTGTFSVVSAGNATDDPFDFTADTTTPVPETAKKATY